MVLAPLTGPRSTGHHLKTSESSSIPSPGLVPESFSPPCYYNKDCMRLRQSAPSCSGQLQPLHWYSDNSTPFSEPATTHLLKGKSSQCRRGRDEIPASYFASNEDRNPTPRKWAQPPGLAAHIRTQFQIWNYSWLCRGRRESRPGFLTPSGTTRSFNVAQTGRESALHLSLRYHSAKA